VGKADMTEMRTAAGETAGSEALRTSFIRPGYQMARIVERHTQRATYEKMVEAITDPNKADELIKIARYSTWDNRAKIALMELLGFAGQDAATRD
jgi:hypothetical protein